MLKQLCTGVDRTFRFCKYLPSNFTQIIMTCLVPVVHDDHRQQ